MSAMVLTPRSLTVSTALSDNLKRKLQVYVEIPPSPLHTSSGSSSFAKINAFNPRKSGTPLTNKALNIDVSRKQEALESPMKKQKLNPSGISSIALEKTSQATVAAERNAKWLEKFPEGFFICHHCRQHKGLKDNHLTCTVRKGPKYCNTNYCNNCIRNHYLKTTDRPDSGDWRCFRCESKCVCWACTKGKAQRAAKAEPMYVRLSGGKSEVVPSPSRLRPVVELPMSPLPKFGPSAPTTKIGKPKRKPVVPQPKWVEVDTDLSQNDAEDRFFIREFLLRFSPIMDISQINLETLDDFEHFSDGAVKSYTMQLLSLIAADAPTGAQNAIKATIKKISSVGLNPGAIWTQLSLLRGTVSSSVLTFPDPDANSSRTSRNRTANAITSSKQLLPIIVALIEVAIQGDSVREEIDNGLADIKEKNRHFAALKRDEHQRWQDETLKYNEEKAEGEKKEGWDAKKWSKQLREASAEHKELIRKIDCQQGFEIQAFAPRFTPLGTDSDGRVYYASTCFKAKKMPSASERESLRRWSWFLAVWGKAPSSLKEGKEDIPALSEGAKPTTEDEETSDEEDDGNRWWGFAEPKEIRTLAKWLADREGLNDKVVAGELVSGANIPQGFANVAEPIADTNASGSGATIPSEPPRRSSKSEIKQLVKGLNDYADVLAWRIGDQKVKESSDNGSVSGSSKGKKKATESA